jgi:hypothetical protein
VTNIRSILLLLLLLSFDLSAGYIKSPDETPLNISICTLPEINGSLDETGLLGLIPKMMFKSGILSTCAIHESLGNIRGDTLSGPSLASSSEADERNIQHCKEIMCRSQNAKLLFDRSEEVIKLSEKPGKKSSLKKIRSVSKKYNEYHKKYGESGSSFADAEKYVGEQLEVLIIEQFNVLPKSTQQKWLSNLESEVAKKRELERIDLAKKRELERISLAKKRELERIDLAKKQELERIDLAKKQELERVDLIKKGGIAFLFLCVLVFSWKTRKTVVISIPPLFLALSFLCLEIIPFDYSSSFERVIRDHVQRDHTVLVNVGDYVKEDQGIVRYLKNGVTHTTKSLVIGTISQINKRDKREGIYPSVVVRTEIQSYKDSEILDLSRVLSSKSDNIFERSFNFIELSLAHSGFLDNGYKSMFLMVTILLVSSISIVFTPMVVFLVITSMGAKEDKRFKTGYKNNHTPGKIREENKEMMSKMTILQYTFACYLFGLLSYFILSVMLIVTYGLSFEIFIGLFVSHLYILFLAPLIVWIGGPFVLLMEFGIGSGNSL